jgi:hypothetical protein
MEETSAFITLSVFITSPRISGCAIINTSAASFRDAANASVTCAIAILASGFDFDLGRYSEVKSSSPTRSEGTGSGVAVRGLSRTI